LLAGVSIGFVVFSRLFWRNLDEDDPDGDEWQQLIASDQFYNQLTLLMNKLRKVERKLQYDKGILSGVCLESI